MKLTKRIFISNEEYELADNKVSLKLSLGGKAIFIVTTTTPPERFALVRFDIGYEQKTAPFLRDSLIKSSQPVMVHFGLL